MLTTKKTYKGDCVMKSIVEEKLVSFKSLEQKIFAYVCEEDRADLYKSGGKDSHDGHRAQKTAYS
jgi:hypothetical protein